jgi:hypothetical protein
MSFGRLRVLIVSLLVIILFVLFLQTNNQTVFANSAHTTISSRAAISSREITAVHWAENQKEINGLPNYSWEGLCLPFVQSAFGVRSGAANPKALAPTLLLFKNNMPPAGHLVIFGDNYVWHIAISAGGGYIIHAPLYSSVEEISIQDWLQKSGEWLVGDSPAPPNWYGLAA